MLNAIRAYIEPKDLSFRDAALTAHIQDSILPGSFIVLKDGTVGKAIYRMLETNAFKILVMRGKDKGTTKECFATDIGSVKNDKVSGISVDHFSVHQRLSTGRLISRTLHADAAEIRSKYFNDPTKTISILLGDVPKSQQQAVKAEIERLCRNTRARVVLLQTETGDTIRGTHAVSPKDFTVITEKHTVAVKAASQVNSSNTLGLGPKTMTAWDEQIQASDLVITIGAAYPFKHLLNNNISQLEDFLKTDQAYLEKRSLPSRARAKRIHPYIVEWIKNSLAETIVDHRIIGNTCYILTKLEFEYPVSKKKKDLYKNDYIISYNINSPRSSIKRIASGFETKGTQGPHRITTLEQLKKAWQLIKYWNDASSAPLNRDTLIDRYTRTTLGLI